MAAIFLCHILLTLALRQLFSVRKGQSEMTQNDHIFIMFPKIYPAHKGLIFPKIYPAHKGLWNNQSVINMALVNRHLTHCGLVTSHGNIDLGQH